MIINYFHLFRPAIMPEKADPPLVVDADTELTRAIPLQSLQAITRRDPQIFKDSGNLQLSDFTSRDLFKTAKASHMVSFRQ